MTVTLLADHRLLDGVPVARALVALEETLAGPIREELAALSGGSAKGQAGDAPGRPASDSSTGR